MAESETQGEWALPDGWAWTTLGECAQVITGTTPSKKDPSNYGDYLPLVKPPQLNDDVIYDAEDKLSVKGAELARVLPPQSVLVSCIGILGKTGISGVPVAFNQQINAVVFPPGILPRYGLYYLQSAEVKRWLNSVASATTVTIVNKSKFQRTRFPLAPLPEQHRIVAEIETQFTRLDAGVAALERAQANLRRYKASVLKAACEGRLVPTEASLARAEGRDYEPAGQLLARILAERRVRWEATQWEREIEKSKQKAAKSARKAAGHLLKRGEKLASEEWQGLPRDVYGKYLPKDDHWKQKYKEPEPLNIPDLYKLPEGWIWTNIGSLFTVSIGGTPSRKELKYWGGDVHWLSSGEVAFCRIKDTREKITALGLANSNAKLNPPGTVLLAMIGEGKTRGQAAVLDVPASNNQNVASIVCSETPILSELVFYWFMARYEQTRRGGVASGGMQPALNSRKVRALPIAVSPLPEQHRIVAEVERRLSVVVALGTSVEAALARARRLRQAVLKQAFEGRLVKQDPDDEPAAVLLGRIKAEKAQREAEGKASRKKQRKAEKAQQLRML